jgi:hypothetical protein
MDQLIKFIDKNINKFSKLENSEVLEYDIVDLLDQSILDYFLKVDYRYFYRNICVYYYDNKICIENTDN